MNNRITLSRTAAMLLALILLCAGCTMQPLSNNALERVPNPEALRREALSLVNQARSRQGAAPLRMNPTLNAAAQAHAEDMARRDFYGHRSPERQDVADRYRANGGGLWAAIGENIFYCSECTADSAQIRKFHEGWMRSAGHRRNIVSQQFDEFGFGVAVAGGRVYAVQTFVRRREY